MRDSDREADRIKVSESDEGIILCFASTRPRAGRFPPRPFIFLLVATRNRDQKIKNKSEAKYERDQ